MNHSWGMPVEWIRTADRLPSAGPGQAAEAVFCSPGRACAMSGQFVRHADGSWDWQVIDRRKDRYVSLGGPHPELWALLPPRTGWGPTAAGLPSEPGAQAGVVMFADGWTRPLAGMATCLGADDPDGPFQWSAYDHLEDRFNVLADGAPEIWTPMPEAP